MPTADQQPRPHRATVIPYSAHPEDTHLSLKIVCHECDSEWGWSPYTHDNNTFLTRLTHEHNTPAPAPPLNTRTEP